MNDRDPAGRLALGTVSGQLPADAAPLDRPLI